MTTRLACMVSGLMIVSFSGYAEPRSVGATPPDPIIGKWVWQKANVVSINGDGSAVHSKGPTGTWKFLNNKEVERKYQFVWDEGVFVDSVALSRDAKKLEGKNQHGERVWAVRAP